MTETLISDRQIGVAFNSIPPKHKPHIVMIVPRGEAVRNFLYSDTLRILSENARVTLLSVIDDERFLSRFRPFVEQIIPLPYFQERRMVTALRSILHETHFRWLDSKVARNEWQSRDAKAKTPAQKLKRNVQKVPIQLLAHRTILELLTEVERDLSCRFPPTNYFDALFDKLNPDLVFNCSHIHGPAGELPAKIAYFTRKKTAGFIFSWDNLTSRSRIFVPYHFYLVWHNKMREQLLQIYPKISSDQVFVTGTPQFDFHFKSDLFLTREELCQRIGIDSHRPFILYTTGIAKHFPDEHRTVEFIINLLQTMDIDPKPQLVVRTYAKGTSPEMKNLAARQIPDVVFPPVLWEEKWFTPLYEDLAIYTNLLRHCSLGINAASTVSLELLMHNKPVINLGFDPPGSHLPEHLHWSRHIEFDHYKPVAESGAVMVARLIEDLGDMIAEGLIESNTGCESRHPFIQDMLGNFFDGNSGRRVAEQLVTLAETRSR
jgi:hypothetical protein